MDKNRFNTAATVGHTKETRQRTASRRTYKEGVLTTAWQYGVYWALAGFGAGLLIAQITIFSFVVTTGSVPVARIDIYIIALPLGFLVGGLAAALEIARQVKKWEDTNILTDTAETPVTAPTIEQERPIMVNGVPKYRRADVLLRHDGKTWEWKGPELDVMLGWYNKGIVRFRRDHDPDNGRPGIMAFNRITTSDYGNIKAIMEGLNIIDERGYWTVQGAEWLKTAGLPFPES
jgi:hypothetical protein